MAHRKGNNRKLSLPISLTDSTHRQQQQAHQKSIDEVKLKKSMVREIRNLEKERDELQNQVINLANFNYAREPEFVRDRIKLRETLVEVSHLKRHVANKLDHVMKTVLSKLDAQQARLAENARKSEEDSEKVAKSYLDGELKYEQFIEEYTKLRKEASKARIIADKLTKDKNVLANNIKKSTTTTTNELNLSPIPPSRQRKKVCFNQ